MTKADASLPYAGGDRQSETDSDHKLAYITVRTFLDIKSLLQSSAPQLSLSRFIVAIEGKPMANDLAAI